MRKGNTTSTVEQSLPAFQEAQFKELFGAAKGVAQQPFIPYTGPMVAGFSPDQLRQFQATRGLFETGMQFDPTKGLQTLAQEARPVTGQAASLLGQDIGAYQSPYQQQVIDLAMQDIQRQADIARGGAQERAIRAGAFGGSRSALLEAESQRPYAEQMARTAAGLRQSGFEQAQRAAEADVARQQQMAMFAPQFELQARQQQAGLLGGLQGQQLQQLGLLGGIGAQQQMLQQRAIDAQRGEFARALGYGPQQVSLLQAGMGTPLISTSGTSSERGSSAEGVGQAAAAIGTIMGLFSDKKLKENIKLIGKSANGHNLYTWNWNDKAKELGINSPTTGVIAQEVMKYMPEAVFKDSSGYYKVNYGVL
jgi:hypothetical protein